MRRLFNSSSLIGSSQLIVNIVLLIRIKFLAVTLGPEGLGIYGLLSSFFLFLSSFLQVWLNSGVTKFSASANSLNDTEQLSFVLTISLLITLVLSILGILPIILFFTFVQEKFLSKEVIFFFAATYSVYFIITGLNSQINSYLLGVQKFKDIAKTRILSSIGDLLSVFSLTVLFGIKGFFASLILSALANLYLLHRCSSSSIKFNFTFISRAKNLIQRMVNFSAINFFLGIFFLGSLYFLRKIILDKLGITQLGIYFSAFTFISQLGFIAQSFASFSVSELAKEISNEYRTKTINDYIYLVLILVTPLFVILIAFQEFIVLIIFGRTFDDMGKIMHIMALAQYISFVFGLFQTALWTSEKNREHSIISIVNLTSNFILSWILLQYFGLPGVAYGFIISTALTLCLAYGLFRKNYDFKFGNKIKTTMILMLTSIVISIIVKDTNMVIKISYTAATFCLSYYLLDSRHKELIKEKILNVLY